MASSLARIIAKSTYCDGKYLIYIECAQSAEAHIAFWLSPHRSAKGASPRQRTQAISSSRITVERCLANAIGWASRCS